MMKPRLQAGSLCLKSFKLTACPIPSHCTNETNAKRTQLKEKLRENERLRIWIFEQAQGGYEKQNREGELEPDDQEATVTGGLPVMLLLPRRLARLFSSLRSGRFLQIPNSKPVSFFTVFLENI